MNTGAFQKVWSSQMSMNPQGGRTEGNAAVPEQDPSVRSGTVKESAVKAEGASKSGDTQAAEDRGSVQENVEQTSGDVQETAEDTQETAEDIRIVGKAQDGENAGQTPDAVESAGNAEGVKTAADEAQGAAQEPEELAQAMEVLGTAALGMIQQAADAFGISVEEVHSAMEELGMEPLDMLNADALGRLVLKLGGAEDSYALITDETLYDNYRLLMGQLDNVLQESAQDLEMPQEEMAGLLEKLSEPQAEVPVEETAVPAQSVERELPEDRTERTPLEAEPQTVSTAEGTVQGGKNAQDAQDAEEQQTESQPRGHSERGSEAGQTVDKAGRSQQFHLFGQDFRTGFQPDTAQTEQIPQGSTWSADTRSIMNQIMDFMKLQLNADTTSLEMQLHPASLGTLQVQIDSKGGLMTAHFITQNESVKAALESQIVQLQDSFEQQGIKVEAIEVTVQTHEFEQNLEQGRERGSQEPGKKSRTRKISLNDSSAAEEREEEDALAADLMAARGGTVDYTV